MACHSSQGVLLGPGSSPPPGRDEGKAQHQQSIAKDRANQRCLHYSDEASLQREDADEEFRQVTNRRLDYTRRRRTKVIAELVGSLADHVGLGWPPLNGGSVEPLSTEDATRSLVLRCIL